MIQMLMADALDLYRAKVSILKKGFAQETYRIEQLKRSFLAAKNMRDVTSVDVATYRDARLAQQNAKTGQPLSPATVRLEVDINSKPATSFAGGNEVVLKEGAFAGTPRRRQEET